MNSNECLNFKQIYRYISNKASKEEAAIVETEIANCASCAEEFKFLQSLYLANKSKTGDTTEKFSDLDLQTFFELEEKFFKGKLTEDQQETFYENLLQSPECFNDFTTHLRSKKNPFEINEDDKKILEQIESAKVEDRLTPYENIFKKSDPNKQKWHEKIKRPFGSFEFGLRRPVMILAVTACCLALFFYLNHKNNITEKLTIASAEYSKIVQNLPVTLKRPRLSGTNAEEFVNFKFTRSADSSYNYSAKKIEEALRMNPNDPKLNHKMGVIKYLNGQSEQAENFLQKAIQLDNKYTPAYNDLSLVKVEKGNPEEALDLLQKALKISPDFLEARFNLAIIYEQLNDKQKAIAAWQEYLKKETNKKVIEAVNFRIQELQN